MPATIQRKLAAPKGAVIGVDFPRGYVLDDGLGLKPKGVRTLDERVAEAVNLANPSTLMWCTARGCISRRYGLPR